MDFSIIQAAPTAITAQNVSVIIEALIDILIKNNENQCKGIEVQGKAAQIMGQEIVLEGNADGNQLLVQGTTGMSGALTSLGTTIVGSGFEAYHSEKLSGLQDEQANLRSIKEAIQHPKESELIIDENLGPDGFINTPPQEQFIKSKDDARKVLSDDQFKKSESKRVLLDSFSASAVSHEKAQALQDRVEGLEKDVDLDIKNRKEKVDWWKDKISQTQMVGQLCNAIGQWQASAFLSEKGRHEMLRQLYNFLVEAARETQQVSSKNVDFSQQQIANILQNMEGTLSNNNRA